MKKNIGTIDRIIRLLVAVVIIILVFTGVIKEALAGILVGLSFLIIYSSLTGFCGLYSTLCCNTLGAKKEKK